MTYSIQIYHVRLSVYSWEISAKNLQLIPIMVIVILTNMAVQYMIHILVLILILHYQRRFQHLNHQMFALIKMFSTPIRPSEIHVALLMPKKLVLRTSIANGILLYHLVLGKFVVIIPTTD